MKIGINNGGYNEQRNIVEPWKHGSVSVKRVGNLLKIADFIWFKLLKSTNRYFHNTIIFNFFNSVQGYHFFNGIWVFATKPWMCSFESIIPRIGGDRFKHFLIKQLLKPQCKAIIAMSKCNEQLQKDYIMAFYPEYASVILPKLKHLYPSQVLPSKVVFENTNKLRFIFVGTDFYRKGGCIALKAFVNCFTNDKTVEIIIISSLQAGYISDYSEENHQWVNTHIKENNQVTWIQGAENSLVLAEMAKSDVVLLPSYADTFGYSILEGMANGCVPVVSNVRALGELVREDSGYVVKTALTNTFKIDPSLSVPEHGAIMQQQLESAFYDIKKCWMNNSLIDKKEAAYLWVKNNCDPKTAGRQLKTWLTEND